MLREFHGENKKWDIPSFRGSKSGASERPAVAFAVVAAAVVGAVVVGPAVVGAAVVGAAVLGAAHDCSVLIAARFSMHAPRMFPAGKCWQTLKSPVLVDLTHLTIVRQFAFAAADFGEHFSNDAALDECF